MRVHGSTMTHAHSGPLHSPDVKLIHAGEVDIPIPLSIDDEGSIVAVLLEDDEIISPPPDQPPCGISDHDVSLVTVPLEEDVVLVPLELDEVVPPPTN
jgi:hypothetical protein